VQTAVDVDELKQISKELRIEIIRMLQEAGSGHPGGSLSEIDILTCLYFGGILNYRADEPDWPQRDRFLLSKGHCTPGYYATLARAGFFPSDWLPTFRKFESPLQGHPDRTRVPGVEISAGSLGQGLSAAVGVALAARLEGATWHTFCMVGDGESQAGQIWEAIMFAGNNRVDNLTCIVDSNQVQQTGFVRDIEDLAPLGDKYRGRESGSPKRARSSSWRAAAPRTAACGSTATSATRTAGWVGATGTTSSTGSSV
jgi:transketolase